jgi:hypothetical protein
LIDWSERASRWVELNSFCQKERKYIDRRLHMRPKVPSLTLETRWRKLKLLSCQPCIKLQQAASNLQQDKEFI